jgi:hypothetical protein
VQIYRIEDKGLRVIQSEAVCSIPRWDSLGEEIEYAAIFIGMIAIIKAICFLKVSLLHLSI